MKTLTNAAQRASEKATALVEAFSNEAYNLDGMPTRTAYDEAKNALLAYFAELERRAAPMASQGDPLWPQGKIADALRGMLRLFDEEGNFTSDFRGIQEATQKGYEALSPAMNRPAPMTPQGASEATTLVERLNAGVQWAIGDFDRWPLVIEASDLMREAAAFIENRLEAHPQQERAEWTCPTCKGTGTGGVEYVGDDMRAVEVECQKCGGAGTLSRRADERGQP